MKRLLWLIATIALVSLGGPSALADAPRVSAEPVVRTDGQSPTAGGSASASGGSAGPAVISSSEPIAASSMTTPTPGGASQGTPTASGPGTSANAPLTGTTTQPDPSTPDSGVPGTATSGPSADADASRTTVSTTDSGGVRAIIISNATGAFGAWADGVGSAQDPTVASTCTTAEATPGAPTNVSLGTACGGDPTRASEDFSATGAGGYGANGTPSSSSCLSATASAGVAPSAGIADACAAPATSTGSTGTAPGDTSAAGGTGSAAERAAAAARATDIGRESLTAPLGITSLPSTTTALESGGSLGVLLAFAGLVLLYRSRRRAGLTWESAAEVRVD